MQVLIQRTEAVVGRKQRVLANLTQQSLYGELWPYALQTVNSALVELQDSAWQDQHDSSPASAKLGMSLAAPDTAA